jgi:hypothetical protein
MINYYHQQNMLYQGPCQFAFYDVKKLGGDEKEHHPFPAIILMK